MVTMANTSHRRRKSKKKMIAKIKSIANKGETQW